MRGTGSSRSLLPVVLALLIGCSPESNTTGPGGPALSHTGIPDIDGKVFLGTGRTNICNRFTPASLLLVRAIATDGSFFSVFPTCPANDFSIPVPPNSYFVRVNLPTDQPLGQLPQRWLEPGSVTVDVADVMKDIHVRNGLPLAGRATVNGSTLVSGLGLTAFYSDLPGFGAGFGVSGPTGSWQDGIFPAGPLYLQAGVRYTFGGCQGAAAPGIREVHMSPAGSFLFPGESNRLDCDFITGDALRYTHQANRLKLSSFPGDIGGMSDPVIFPDLGFGYSAQFPLPLGQPPHAGPELVNRQLFRGGLLLGIAPDVVLAGVELQGYLACAVSPCRAFGFDGTASVQQVGARKEITWTYSDAGSQRPMGLAVSQRSFEGPSGTDYVLYLFHLTNRGKASITFTTGVFLDWDVTPNIRGNIGYTELDGQLMITTDASDLGPHFGSVIVQNPPARRSFFSNSRPPVPEADLVSILRGEISNSAAGPADVWSFQGGSTVKLGRGKSTDVWVAIVAGDDRAQTIANAQAAIADANSRMGKNLGFSTGNWEAIRRVDAASRAATRTGSGVLCKTGCTGD